MNKKEIKLLQKQKKHLQNLQEIDFKAMYEANKMIEFYENLRLAHEKCINIRTAILNKIDRKLENRE